MLGFSPERQGKKRVVLGIDLRAFSVKVVEVEVSPRGRLVKKWGKKEFEAGSSVIGNLGESPKLAALKAVLNESKIKTKRAAVCISGPEVIVRHLVLPKISHKETYQAIKLQVEGWTSFSPEEAIFDFVLLRETAGQAHYLVAVARKSLVYEAVSLLRACGLNCLFISVIPLALRNAFPAEAEHKEATCLIYMGKHNTNINIFKQGMFEFNREVTVGGDTITRAMVGVVLTEKENLEIDYRRAEELKVKFGIPIDLDAYTRETNIPAVQVLAFMRPALEKIEAELLRSFNYYRSQSGDGEISRIIMAGGGAKTRNFVEMVGEALGIPVERGAIKDLLGVQAPPDFQVNLLDFAVALGVALEDREPKINLLPEEIKARFKFLWHKFVRPETVGVGILVLLLMVYLGAWVVGFVMQTRLDAIESEIKSLRPETRKVEKLQQKIRGREEGQSVFSAVLGEHKKLVSVLEKLGRIIPESVVLDAIEIKEQPGKGKISISGKAFSYERQREEVLAKFIAALERLDRMAEVKLVSATADRSYTRPALVFLLETGLE